MKILYLSTIIATINGFLTPHIKALAENRHAVDVAGNFTTEISQELKQTVRNLFNLPLQRTPFSLKNLSALKSIIKIIKENKYDVVHVHTPVASVIGRIACWLTKTRCFYTAHGFHFYNGAPLKNWLIYFPIEFVLSFVTDTLITINKEDYEFAKKYLHAKRIEYIPGVGIDVERFANVQIDKKAKRKELGISEDCKLLLSVGELNKNKNHQLVLKALAQINDKNIHYAICGRGEFKDYLLNLAKELKLNERFHLLGRRNDIAEILKCADVFVHPSLREGLPVSVMEALASGLPCVVSDIRGNKDLIENGVNGYLIKNNNIDEYSEAILKFLNEKKTHKKDIGYLSVGSIIKKTNELYIKHNKIRILHILNTSSFSGAENVACQIIKMFKEDANYEMAYCSPDGNIRNVLLNENIVFLPVKKLDYFELRRIIKTYEPDIIHAHDMRASFFSAISCVNIPIISHIHNNSFASRKISIKSVLFLIAATKIKHIYWVSESAYKDYIFIQYLKRKSEILCNIININNFIEKANKDRKKYDYDIVYIGRLSNEKNPLRMVKIINEVIKKRPFVKVAVIGEGELKNDVYTLLREYNITNNVILLGFVNNPYKILSEAKLMIMTSLWEGMPMCALEAMSFGIPIVSTPTDGLIYLVDNNFTGFLSNDDNELVSCCIKLIDDCKLNKQFGINSKKKMKILMNKEKYIVRLKSIYGKVKKH